MVVLLIFVKINISLCIDGRQVYYKIGIGRQMSYEILLIIIMIILCVCAFVNRDIFIMRKKVYSHNHKHRNIL